MKIAIMQPYFMPYIGYFQLIAAVDIFIIYDNVKYTKKGWINRNRMLLNGNDSVFTLPLKYGSDYLDIRDRELASSFSRDKLINSFKGAYRHAPYFDRTIKLIEEIVWFESNNLFCFVFNSVNKICQYLGITTKIEISSEVLIDHELKKQNKVLALCEVLQASTYINAIGGIDLYSKENFRSRGIELQFIKSRPFEYAQFSTPFVAWLSIIDVLMFNAPEQVQAVVDGGYELV